jgi:hypothetical protein
MASKKKNEKDHRARRDMGSAEFFRKQRKERNAARGKQTWVGGETTKEGGRWERATPRQ